MGADREHLEFPNMILTAHDFLEATAVPRQNKLYRYVVWRRVLRNASVTFLQEESNRQSAA